MQKSMRVHDKQIQQFNKIRDIEQLNGSSNIFSSLNLMPSVMKRIGRPRSRWMKEIYDASR
jgi:hypothetical protein